MFVCTLYSSASTGMVVELSIGISIGRKIRVKWNEHRRNIPEP